MQGDINMHNLIKLLFCVAVLLIASCQKNNTETAVDNGTEHTNTDAAAPEKGTKPMDTFNYAKTISATEADVLKALQGEWSSKENGFNFTLVIEGKKLKLGYQDRELMQTEFEIKPGMPISIVPGKTVFNRAQGRGYTDNYNILSMYFVNGRITLSIRSADEYSQSEDELVLSRELTREALVKNEPAVPGENLVYDIQKTVTAKEIHDRLQGQWEGRDNCNYSVRVQDNELSVLYGKNVVIKSPMHLSIDNPAHVELDSYDLGGVNGMNDTVYGLYYLDETSILISVRSDYQGDKYEYILHHPEYLGRYTLDKDIIPQIEGKWVTDDGKVLTIHGNTIEYGDSKDTFHVITRSFWEKEHNIYYLVGEKSHGDGILELFSAMEYKDDTLSTYIPVFDAPSPRFVFHRMK